VLEDDKSHRVRKSNIERVCEIESARANATKHKVCDDEMKVTTLCK
jgi:hypothetical protein